MRGGQNRLSTEEKELRGTLKKSRAKARAPKVPLSAVGPPPRGFTVAQKAAWKEIAPQVARVFTASDRSAFVLLVKQWAILDSPRALKLPPHVYATLVKMVAGLLQQFGLTPASRGRVELAPPGKGEFDKDEEFLFGGMGDPLDEFGPGSH